MSFGVGGGMGWDPGSCLLVVYEPFVLQPIGRQPQVVCHNVELRHDPSSVSPCRTDAEPAYGLTERRSAEGISAEGVDNEGAQRRCEEGTEDVMRVPS